MTRHGWFACPAAPAILFDTPTDARWAAAFKGEGIDPRLLGSETGAADSESSNIKLFRFNWDAQKKGRGFPRPLS